MATISTTPIEVVFKKVKEHDEEIWVWSIEPKHEGDNKDRYRKHKDVFKDKWTKRNGQGNPPDPDKDHHFPIVFEVGETLNFTCEGEHAFGIGAKKNTLVDDFPGAPDNPFGWPPNSDPHAVAAGASFAAIVKPAATGRPGPREQAFYKFHGWVLENGEFKPIDPDGYCGS